MEKARSLTTRKLEEEIARVAPKEVTPERIKFVTADRLELRLGISKATEEKLKRVQDLESQRTAHAVSLEVTLETLLDVYLESKDPLKRAEREMKRKSIEPISNAPASVTGHANRVNTSENRAMIPAIVRHQVHLRDMGRCTHLNRNGERCKNRRWIDVHHIRERSLGGANTVENLAILCSAHHRMEHRQKA